jgi:hypothetical protein
MVPLLSKVFEQKLVALVNLFFCFIVTLSGTMMLNGGSSINGMDERLINLREE